MTLNQANLLQAIVQKILAKEKDKKITKSLLAMSHEIAWMAMRVCVTSKAKETSL